MREICEELMPFLPRAEFLAGIEMGGIPLTTVLSQMTLQTSLFVRKEAKKYGTAKLAKAEIELIALYRDSDPKGSE
ncbi:MAG: hypothetical protein O3C68_08530 [Proteobacteria bacterium]|nr:hypothetical protein [Pseudomonadota bacterium]